MQNRIRICVCMADSGFDYLGGLESFRSGEFSVQDISSMLVGETADPQTNDYVIDVCAAPGGKSSMWRKSSAEAGMWRQEI